MLVRFACVCDHCGKRSHEYEMWPCCRECGEDVCWACGEFWPDGPESWKTVCKRCVEKEKGVE